MLAVVMSAVKSEPNPFEWEEIFEEDFLTNTSQIVAKYTTPSYSYAETNSTGLLHCILSRNSNKKPYLVTSCL